MAYNFEPFPVLSSERLTLRKIEFSDDDELFALRSSPTVMKYLDRPLMNNVTEARAFIEMITAGLQNNQAISWGISLREDPRLLGTIAFWKMDPANFRAEIGYMLHSQFHGKGYMQEAMSSVLHFGFTALNLHSVEANVNPGNEGSIKLLEKNGFVREGYFRENYFFDGRFIDSAVYSLIRPA